MKRRARSFCKTKTAPDFAHSLLCVVRLGIKHELVAIQIAGSQRSIKMLQMGPRKASFCDTSFLHNRKENCLYFISVIFSNIFSTRLYSTMVLISFTYHPHVPFKKTTPVYSSNVKALFWKLSFQKIIQQQSQTLPQIFHLSRRELP